MKKKEFYIVGIGASAGGLEAIEALFSNIPLKSGLAYVIIQHLSPNYKSLMPEILLKRTPVPIHTAEDGMEVRPDNVYLIPRKMNMKIFHSRLRLTEKDPIKQLNLPIDIFFQSLAEDFTDKAIAVILSGTGSDGSRGIRIIKENGGLVIAQQPDTSRFDGMPKSAIISGTVDYILPPEDIPQKIHNYIFHPHIQDVKKKEVKIYADCMSNIIMILKDSFGLDFTYYKESTILRRIDRRLSINQIKNLKDYIFFLEGSKTEQKTLYKELLIGVTKFFREPEAFQYIKDTVLPDLFKNKNNNSEMRVWVSACSSGEEAYSIAILIDEYLRENYINCSIKIFATDIDKTAIEFASEGVYNSSIAADISSERIYKYFTQNGDTFKINERIRAMIVFANHNVIKDPPFNNIDLLSCRNLLIYFQTPLQQKVLSTYSFALRQNGYLFLGSSETIGDMETYFKITDHKHKIFKSVKQILLSENKTERLDISKINSTVIEKLPTAKKRALEKDYLPVLVSEKIINDVAPITIIVNELFDIINSFGDLNKFLVLPTINKVSEGFSYNITKMVPKNLKLTFSLAISKALKSGKDISYQNIKYIKSPNDVFSINVFFSPLKLPDISKNLVIIYFYESNNTILPEAEILNNENIGQQTQQRIIELETELKHLREHLQASIEELETTNEELQSTNEELISANEELQSTNEELQSVNEELYTVNAEFQAKNSDLVQTYNDIENLLQNSDIPIIFLDNELNIRKYTNNVVEIFNIKEKDNGRPLADITHNINEINVKHEITKVRDENISVHKTIIAESKTYKMKILPYITQRGYIDGIVLSFIDVTDYVETQSELKLSEDKFQLLSELVFDAFYLLSAVYDKNNQVIDFKIIDVNGRAEQELKMKKSELIGRGICELFPINKQNGFFEIYKNVFQTKTSCDQEYTIPNNFAAPGIYYHQIVPTNTGVAIFNRNISKIKRNENKLLKINKLYRSLFDNINQGFALLQLIYNNNKNIDYYFIDVNTHFEKITGINKADVFDINVKQLFPQLENFWIETYAKNAISVRETSFIGKTKDLDKKFRVKAFSPYEGQFIALFEEINKKIK